MEVNNSSSFLDLSEGNVMVSEPMFLCLSANAPIILHFSGRDMDHKRQMLSVSQYRSS